MARLARLYENSGLARVGGSLGAALLNTSATTAIGAYVNERGPAALRAATVDSYSRSFTWSVAACALASFLAGLLLTRHESEPTAFEHAKELGAGS